jgi:hypothetical protein
MFEVMFMMFPILIAVLLVSFFVTYHTECVYNKGRS